MDKSKEDKTITTDAPNTAAPAGGANDASASSKNNDAPAQQSWGDKYGLKTYGFVRNIAVNYVVNFAISALLTYGFLKSPLNKPVKHAIEYLSEKGEQKLHIPKKLGEFLGEFITRTQILLCGGHSLLPFMKWTHDHKKEIKYEAGHKLDLLQEFVGKGNAASKQHIKEYHHISGLLSLAKHNRTQENPVTIQLSESDKALLAKNGINDDLKFNEHKRTWKEVLKARGVGMSFTTTLSAVFALGSFFGARDKWNMPPIDVKNTYLKKLGGTIGYKYFDWMKHTKIVSSKPFQAKKDQVLLGQLAVLELIYTFFSKLGFDQIEKKQLHQEAMLDEAQDKARLAHDRAQVPPDPIKIEQDREALADLGVNVGITTPGIVSAAPKPDARRKLLESGGQDFRAREINKPDAPGMALT